MTSNMTSKRRKHKTPALRAISVSLVMSTVIATGVCLPSIANAHHSHANLDKNNIQQHTGTVVKYSWRMPHVYIKVEAPNKAGDLVQYSIELLHPPAMLEFGWTKNSFKPGDKITWEGLADKNPDRYYSGLIWAEKEDGTRLNKSKKKPTTIEPSTDFTGLWVRDLRGKPGHYQPPQDWPYTDAGKKLVADFNDTQNPQFECKNPGPPKATLLPYPIKISRPDADTIVFDYELRENPRHIYLDKDHPRGQPSALGHSIASFDNGDLVIETDNFVADRWGTHTGIDSSAQKKLTERYTLSDDGLALTINMTVSDPVYLTEPVNILHYLRKIADRPLVSEPCSLENARLFIEKAKARSKLESEQ